jgi:hypothetical protein
MLPCASEIELCPGHLPPVGLTGWRALVTKSRNAQPGRNILVTGIGGGIALQVLQIGVAIGCPAHGEFFVQLVDGETKDIPSQAMFVKGKGYVKILKVTLR